VPDIRLKELSKSYGTSHVLNGINLEVGDKEFVTLLGPSGCGKTTTLMAIAGFEDPDSGVIMCGDQVFFDGNRRHQVPAERRNLGIVFQSYAIWPHMTVAANVGFPLALRKVKKSDIERRVTEMLELVELGELGKQYPHQLSGGQQQRVALARALSSSPSVLLLDEPFSNLDAKLRERSRKWLRSLQREIGITTVFVTHDQDEALSMSDRIMVMDRGVIQQSGSPEDIYRRPANRIVADFVGRCNLLECELLGPVNSGSAMVRINETSLIVKAQCPLDVESGKVLLALRPEEIHMSSGEASLPNQCHAEVQTSAYLGDHYEYEVSLGGIAALVQTDHAITEPAAVATIPDLAATVVER
jgi:iron(III) transport system ATP-binding protein